MTTNEKLNQLVKSQDINVLREMIKKGANVFDLSNLIVACKNLDFEMIKLLVEQGVEVNNPYLLGDELPHRYCFENPLSIVCSHSTIKAEDGNCAPHLQTHSSKVLEIIKYFIDNGADVNIDSPLMAACSLEYGSRKTWIFDAEGFADVNLEIIELLIENGANVNYVDYDDKSVLMKAVNRFNAYNLSKILIEAGADVNHTDKLGNSVIMSIEVEPQYCDIWNDNWEELINKTEIHTWDKFTYEPQRVLKLLIENSADINHKNNFGFTPLMKYSFDNNRVFIDILLENGADVNAKSEMTAYDLASNHLIKAIIQKKKNNNPQKLVKLLSNFTIDKPIKYTTHTWDFGELKKEYGDFDGYMNAVTKQFESMKSDLEELSPNLYKKIYTFLLEKNPDEEYSWCSKTLINIGWSSLEGLKQWCDGGNNPFDFKLSKPIYLGRKQIVIFGEVINLFKQEIEIRADFKNLEQIFLSQNIKIDLSTAKIQSRQFYTDTQKFSSILSKIFGEMKKREDFIDVKVTTTELEDRSIEIKITQVDSYANKNANAMLQEVEDGDFADIKESLTNLCDWSIESCYEDENFRVNFLHSNNVKDIEMLDTKAKGFTHILRFYK